jgi:hypothetical protein
MPGDDTSATQHWSHALAPSPEGGFLALRTVQSRAGFPISSVWSFDSMSINRVDVEAGQMERTIVIERDDYYPRMPGDFVSESDGTVYFTTATGDKYEMVPQVCRLPLEGDVRCHELSQLDHPDKATLVGARDGNVYVRDDDASGLRNRRIALE